MNTLQTIAKANAVEIPATSIASIVGNNDDSWTVDGTNVPDISTALERAAVAGKSHYRIAYMVNGRRCFDMVTTNRFYGGAR